MSKRARLTVAALLGTLAVIAGRGGVAAAAPMAPGYDEVKAKLWSLEQSTFAIPPRDGKGRRGAVQSPYFRPYPAGWSDRSLPPAPKGGAPKPELTFVNMAYNGGTAVVMFKAHRHTMAAGPAADEYYEVTDTWSLAGSTWRLLASTLQPVEPPEEKGAAST